MANNAQKRFNQEAAQWSFIMWLLIIAINVLYVGSYVWASYGDDFVWSYWDIVWLMIYLFIERQTYFMIEASVRSGIQPSYALDIFVIFLMSQAVGIFS